MQIETLPNKRSFAVGEVRYTLIFTRDPNTAYLECDDPDHKTSKIKPPKFKFHPTMGWRRVGKDEYVEHEQEVTAFLDLKYAEGWQPHGHGTSL